MYDLGAVAWVTTQPVTGCPSYICTSAMSGRGLARCDCQNSVSASVSTPHLVDGTPLSMARLGLGSAWSAELQIGGACPGTILQGIAHTMERGYSVRNECQSLVSQLLCSLHCPLCMAIALGVVRAASGMHRPILSSKFRKLS